jgi:hypothetical protein
MHRLSPAYLAQHPRIQEDVVSHDPIVQRQAYCDVFLMKAMKFLTRPGPPPLLPRRRRLQPPLPLAQRPLFLCLASAELPTIWVPYLCGISQDMRDIQRKSSRDILDPNQP